MRALSSSLALALAAATAGCLSAPTGRDPDAIDAATDGTVNPNAWPPPAASIVAITAGDVDTDGKDDIVALDTGGGGRVFLLRGGVDLDPTRPSVTTVSDSATLAGLRAPAAVTVAIAAGRRHIVVLDNPPAGPRITIFNAALVQTGQSSISLPAATGGQTVTLGQTGFGMNMNAVFGSVPDAVFFMEGNALGMASPSVMTLPESGATPFANVLAVGGFVVPGTPATPRVFVSEPTLAQRADSPGLGQFNWSTNRPAGAPWQAQAVADIIGTSDTFPDVVGFAPDGAMPADICVLDVQAGSAPPCYATQFGMDMASIAVGPVVNGTQSDVALIHVNPGMPNNTAVFVVARLRVAGGMVQADSFSPPTMFPIMEPLLALAQLDTAGKEIIVMGRNGAVQCARSNGGAPVACQ
jgi:hypothetical protein